MKVVCITLLLDQLSKRHHPVQARRGKTEARKGPNWIQSWIGNGKKRTKGVGPLSPILYRDENVR